MAILIIGGFRLVLNLKVFLISFTFLFSGQPFGGVLAVVGDEIITQGDFFQQLSLVAEQKGKI